MSKRSSKMKGWAPCYDNLHCMRENNEISFNIFKIDDSGEAIECWKGRKFS